jgi:hypothetical protein
MYIRHLSNFPDLMPPQDPQDLEEGPFFTFQYVMFLRIQEEFVPLHSVQQYRLRVVPLLRGQLFRRWAGAL